MHRLAKLAVTASALVALGSAFPLQAFAKEAGDILVRVRAIYVTPDESSTLSVGTSTVSGEAAVDDQIVPEVDISYFLTNNIALELIAATTPHPVDAVGSPLAPTVDLGDVWLLPPTLSLQYHLNPKGQISPYVGAGINYTIFYNEDSGAAQDIDYENSFGFALQAGVDVMLNDKWFLNLDVKKYWLSTDVTITVDPTLTVLADVDIDPWIFGIGVGYRF